MLALCDPPKATKPAPIKKAYKEYKKQPFLAAYAKYGTIWRAAREVGISRDAVHDWRNTDSVFSAAFESCAVDVTEQLEQTAISGALAGDVALLIFMLKSRNPQQYSDRYRERVAADVANEMTSVFLNAIQRSIPPACTSIRDEIAETLNQESDRIRCALAR